MTRITKEMWLTMAFFSAFAVSWMYYGAYSYAKAYAGTTEISFMIAGIVMSCAWIIISALIIREKKKNADLAERKKIKGLS